MRERSPSESKARDRGGGSLKRQPWKRRSARRTWRGLLYPSAGGDSADRSSPRRCSAVGTVCRSG